MVAIRTNNTEHARGDGDGDARAYPYAFAYGSTNTPAVGGPEPDSEPLTEGTHLYDVGATGHAQAQSQTQTQAQARSQAGYEPAYMYTDYGMSVVSVV